MRGMDPVHSSQNLPHPRIPFTQAGSQVERNFLEAAQKTTRQRTYAFPVPMHPGDLPLRIVASARRLIEQVRKEDEDDG